jgi:hypothetical protein
MLVKGKLGFGEGVREKALFNRLVGLVGHDSNQCVTRVRYV